MPTSRDSNVAEQQTRSCSRRWIEDRRQCHKAFGLRGIERFRPNVVDCTFSCNVLHLKCSNRQGGTILVYFIVLCADITLTLTCRKQRQMRNRRMVHPRRNSDWRLHVAPDVHELCMQHASSQRAQRKFAVTVRLRNMFSPQTFVLRGFFLIHPSRRIYRRRKLSRIKRPPPVSGGSNPHRRSLACAQKYARSNQLRCDELTESRAFN